ncbi:MAG: acetylornithine deacetylase [Gammaproteobacteria bacterium]|nr:acetylornithine deacetylase [Gammaproteobacteria bacterium]
MGHRIPSVREMLGELVALPSVSSVDPAGDRPNQAMIERLAGWLEGLGFAVEVLPLAARPGKANLVATLGAGEAGLALAGHTDTVPYDVGRWRHDPFRLTESEGRLYGLGTADMKGFLALAVAAAAAYRPRDLRAPLTVLATADEESGMDGARALLEAGRPPGRHAVIGEPTGLRPVRMHKGVMMEAIRLQGRSGHSSDPRLGVNALEGMHRILSALIEWRQELAAEHRDPAFDVPEPTLNLGYIRGGDNPNRICGECELRIDLRLLPGMDIDALRAALRARAERAIAGSGLTLRTEALFPGIPPLATPADAPVVRAAETLTGQRAQAVAFGTEGPFLDALGTQTVVLGPGDIAQAHQPDEYLALDRIEPMLEILHGLIGAFCLEGDSRARETG